MAVDINHGAVEFNHPIVYLEAIQSDHITKRYKVPTYVYSVGLVSPEQRYLPVIQVCRVIIHFCDWLAVNMDTYLPT